MTILRNKQVQRWILALAITYLALLLLHLFVQPMLDDLWYAEKATEMDLFTFTKWYYEMWSGRIPCHALNYIFMGYLYDAWRFINPIVLMLLSYGMVRISGAAISIRNFLIALMLFFLLGQGIMDFGVLWATGSINYLWPAALAVFLLIPFIDLVFKQNRNIRFFPAFIVLAIVAPMCSEQSSLCILGCIFVTVIHYIIKHRAMPWKHLILLILSVLSAVVMFIAPGNALRTESAIVEYYPTFGDMSVIDKISNGFPWLMRALFVSLMLLFTILFALSLYRYLKTDKGAKSWLRWPLICLFAFSVAMFLFSGTGSFLFTFANAGALVNSKGIVYYLVMFFSYLLWALFTIGLFYLLGKTHIYFALGLLMAICSLAVMMFSPTIEASGERTLLFAGIILIILIVGYLKKPAHPYLMTFFSFLSGVGYFQLFFRLPYLPL